MGFTTGFLGGITLTTTLLYLTLNLHTRNRIHQAALLHQQSLILTTIVEPQPPLPAPVSREVRAGLWETAKDRWNAELEGVVRRTQSTDWGAVGARMEEGVSRTWRRAFQGAERGVDLGVEKVGEGVDVGREKIAAGVREGLTRAEAGVKEGVSRVEATVGR